MTTNFEVLTAICFFEPLDRELKHAAHLRQQIARLTDELDVCEAVAEDCANDLLKDDADLAHTFVADGGLKR
jgi:hypothetical protein